jgi:hypothetical protein
MAQKPAEIPDAVVEGIKRYARQHGRGNPDRVEEIAREIVQNLHWDALCGCYFFVQNSVFHGVELDGHIHT